MKIATLTLNPALDRTMFFNSEVKIGELNRAFLPSVTNIGGKGIDVSIVLKNLGIDSRAYGFVGGKNGQIFVGELAQYKIISEFINTKCETRMNIKILSINQEPTELTEFNEKGGPVLAEECDKLKRKINNFIKDNESNKEESYLFIGGSLPVGVDKNFYREIINNNYNNRAKFILDCDGEALKLCMNNENKNMPFMIKPNLFELEQFVNKKFDLNNKSGFEFENIKCELKKIYDETGVIILCTLGEYGGIFCGEEGVFYKAAPKISKEEVKGFTGAGDCFLAAFSAVYFGWLSFGGLGISENKAEDALNFAIAASAAKVKKAGTEFPELEEILEQLAIIR